MLRTSPHKTKIVYSPSKTISPSKHYSEQYYSHHSNCLYMGGAEAFKKTGAGVLLMDNGRCILSNHSHNNMVGHNVIFENNSITSLIIDSHYSKDVCFRFQQFLLHYQIDKKKTIEGIGHLIDFKSQKIYHLTFRSSAITKKLRIMDSDVEKEVFVNKNYEYIIDRQHAQTLRLNLVLPKGVWAINSKNYYQIGFMDKNKKKINGLGFNIKINNISQKIDVVIGDRGYYVNSMMQHFGEIHFQNGNYYIGELKKNQFEGYGLLVDTQTKQWTYSQYQKNEIVKMIDSSAEIESPSEEYDSKQIKDKKLSHYLKILHSYQKSYIEGRVIIDPSQKMNIELLNKTIHENYIEHESYERSREQTEKIRKLGKIQEDFTRGNYQYQTKQAINQLLSQNKNSLSPNKQENHKIQSAPRSPSPPQSTNTVRINYSPQRKKTEEFPVSKKLQFSSSWRDNEIRDEVIRKYRNQPDIQHHRQQQQHHKQQQQRHIQQYQRQQKLFQPFNIVGGSSWRDYRIVRERSSSRGRRYKYFFEDDDLDERLEDNGYFRKTSPFPKYF